MEVVEEAGQDVDATTKLVRRSPRFGVAAVTSTAWRK